MKLPRLFKHMHKHSHEELSFAAKMTGGAAALMLCAVVIASGGPVKFVHLLAEGGVLPQQLLACPSFGACNTTAYEVQMLIPTNTSNVVSSTYLTSQTVYFHWVAGTYGANHYSVVCDGPNYAQNGACAVTKDTPQYSWPACNAPYTVCDSYSLQCTGYDKWGNCTSSSNVCTSSHTVYDTADCGNAAAYYGHACYSGSDGTTVVGWQPSCQWGSGGGNGWDGSYPFSSLAMTMPSTAGSYTYWFSSYYLNHASQMNSSLSNLSPISVTLNVIDCNTSGFSSPWNSTSYLILAGGKGTVNNWYGRFCIQNVSSKAIYVPMATQTEWNNFKSAASGLSVNVFSY